MKKLNVIIVYSVTGEEILMCLRSKDPYKGFYNLVGGKVEANETDLEAAYRELEEETGITTQDVNLTHLMDLTYYLRDIILEVYVGKLNKEVVVTEEVNKLYWFKANDDFFDEKRFAGEGSIGHMMNQVKIHALELFK